MTQNRSMFLAGLLVGALLASGGFAWFLRQDPQSNAGSAPRAVLKLGHTLDASHPVHIAMKRMRGRLEELSGGGMFIDIYPGTVLGTEVQYMEQLQNGSLAMAKTSAAATRPPFFLELD